MSPKKTVIEKKHLKKFVQLAVERLEGEWVLIGGTLLPILGVHHRVTMDIDLIGKTEKEQSRVLDLLKLSEECGLPVEAINQAGGLFLSRISGHEKNLMILKESKNCKILRPNLALFLELKLARMSETDQVDCEKMISWSFKNEDSKQQMHALKTLQKLKKKPFKESKVEFIEMLEELLETGLSSSKT